MARKSRVSGTIWALSVATFINRATGFLGLFAAVFFTEIRLSDQAVVIALLVVGISGVLGSLMGGHLADKIGKVPVLISSSVINTVLFAALALANYSIGWLLVALSALSVLTSQAFVGPASALVAASATGRERVSRFAFYRIFINVGSIVAPALVGIIGREHFNVLFWLSTMGSLLVPMILVVGIRGDSLLTDVASAGAQQVDTKSVSTVVSGPHKVHASKFRVSHFLARIMLPCVYAAMAFAMVVYAQHQSAVPLRLEGEPGGVQLYSLLLIINPVIVIFLEYPLSHATKLLPAFEALTLGILIMGVGVVLTGSFTTIPTVVIAGWVLFSIGECIFAPMSNTYVAELSPQHAQSRSQAYLATAQSIGAALGPGIGSWMLLVFSAGAWGGFLILTVLAAVLVMFSQFGKPQS